MTVKTDRHFFVSRFINVDSRPRQKNSCQGGTIMSKEMKQQVQAAEWTPPTKLWNPMFLSIFCANLFFHMAQQSSNSLLSLYAKSTGAPADQIGQLMSMFAVTALIFRFVSGPAMNSFSRKKLVSMSTLIMTTAYLGFSFSPKIAEALGLDVINVMKVFRTFQGIGNAFGSGCFLTIVADTLPKDKFTTGMGYFSCAQVIAQSIGPTVGVFLRDLVGYNMVYIIFACIMTGAFFAIQVIKAAPQNYAPFRINLKNAIAKEALVPAFTTFLVAMGFTSINAFMLVYAEERGISGGSLFFTVYALTMLVTRPTVGRMTEKHGFVKVAIPALMMTAASLVLIGFSTNLPTLLFAAFVNAFGYGAVQPMLQSLAMKSVPSERRGSASSTNYIFLDTATIIGPTVCGYVADALGYTPVMWMAMAVPVVCAVAFAFAFRKRITQIETDFAAR